MYENNMISGVSEEKKSGERVSRKHLLPLFIMEILEAHSDYQHHCSQKFIREMLSAQYGLLVERKAVSKHLHTLLMEDLCVFGDEKSGYWSDRKAYISGRES